MNSERGNLLVNGFHIEPRDFSIVYITFFIIGATLVAEFIIVIAVITGLLNLHNISWFMILLLVADGAIIFPLNGEIRHELRARNGDLDWDIYDNGILIKEWKQFDTQIPEDVSVNRVSAPPPWKQLGVRFVKFEDISRIYFTENATKDERRVKLFITYYDKDPQSKGSQIVEEHSPLWGAARDLVHRSILFEGKDGHLLFKPVERKNIKDIQVFENIIRQKVELVE